MAIKLHFSQDNFDVFKNRGSVKGTRDTFNSRNDRFFFDKLARKYSSDRDLIQFYVANFAYGNESVIYSQEESQSNIIEWTRRKESITKIFSDDCSTIINDAYKKKLTEDSVINFTLNKYPSILTLYLGKQISLETIRILDDFDELLSKWKSNSSLTLLWDSEIRRLAKSKGFVKYDTNKVSTVYQSFKEELKEL
jgi:hypothetical protein